MRFHSKARIAIGIDPARSGSITCIQSSDDLGAVLLFAVAWKPATRAKKRVYKVSYYRDGKTREKIAHHPSMIARGVSDEIYDTCISRGWQLEEVDFVVSCEDAYIGRSAKTGISVARFGGQISGVLEAFVRTEAVWVRAADWRKSILNLNHFTKREAAKKASLLHVPPLVVGLRDALKTLGKLDHITDASGVALWGLKHTKKS